MKPLPRFNLVFSFDESGMRMSKDQILILSVVMMFSALLGFMAWVTFTGNLTPLGFAMMWTFRILGPLGFIGSAALYFKLKYRRDLAPDYLGSICTPYFGQNGLCFAFIPTTDNGNTCLDTYFMSQFDQPSKATIVLRPAPKGLLQKRADIPPSVVPIECPPGGFGCVRVPFPFPTNLQSQTQRLEIGATVKYPSGKGRRIRFQAAGLVVETDSEFGGKLTNGRFADFLAAILPLSTPPYVEFPLPSGNSASQPESAQPESQIYWQLGEPKIDVQKMLES